MELLIGIPVTLACSFVAFALLVMLASWLDL